MIKMIGYHIYIVLTVLLTVYGQLVMKWRIGSFGALPELWVPRIKFLLNVLFDPFVFSGFVAAFLASFCWMAAMTKFEISYAYPFMSLNFVFVFLISVPLFSESFNLHKLAGVFFIVLGTVLISRSQ
ncbi:hypothetical protein BZG06_15705 [Salinivibrio kushneri]|uniref:EamA family transporter n=1 Tax=Salinivibrio kushneri TaxID=1908198 RepID=UPI0009887484|nr:EamA family transporter [Salinivibrio kushneri]OOE39544.1 hypothetical protein BZG06_15705 [Salinivibrio kushneri]